MNYSHRFGKYVRYGTLLAVSAAALMLGGCLAVAAGAGAGYIAGTAAADHHDHD